jgi:hypothetical protein
MERQRGSAFILVLIALALGSLLITPTLNYVSTGITEARVSKELLLNEYAADAAIEYGMWQLKYNVDGIIDGLNVENPSSSTSITVNGIEVPVTTEISFSPDDGEGAFTAPPSESGIHLAVALAIMPTVWAPAGQKCYATHLVYIYNYGTATIHLKGLFQELDPALTYVEGSYEGPGADLTKTSVGDHWELYFDFTKPLPKLRSQEMMCISFTAWTSQNMGADSFSGGGRASYAAFQEDEILTYSGESGAASFGLYDITVTVGSYTVLVNVGVTEEGEIVMRSWQIQ